jgi:hypothetical protein
MQEFQIEIEYHRVIRMEWLMRYQDLCIRLSFSIAKSDTSHAIREAQRTDVFIQNK